jgi:riboflavin synthase
MFTGLIEATGKVISLSRSARGAALRLEAPLEGLGVGDSVAVNGVCQTVARIDQAGISCDVLPETLRVTNLGLLRPGETVNLERALRPGDRLGGHFVNGHVDGMGRVVRVIRAPLGLEIEVPRELGRYIVPKGPIAVDGISLTVGPNMPAGLFSVFIIPHTWNHTNLRSAVPGRKVNIEIDILAKYVERLVPRGGGGGPAPER